MRTSMRTLTEQLSLGIRIVLLVVGALIVSTSVAQTSLEEWLQILEEELDESEQRALAEMLLTVRISATDLVGAYISNQDTAEQRYADVHTPLEVTGEIRRIARGFFGARFIELASRHTSERGSGVVSCYFRDQSDAIDQYLARFEPDQIVTLRGSNQGWSGKAVDLHDCVVLSAEAAPIPETTPEEPSATRVTQEPAADPESPPLCAELDSLESFESATLEELDRCLSDAGVEVPVTPDPESPAPAVVSEVPTPDYRVVEEKDHSIGNRYRITLEIEVSGAQTDRERLQAMMAAGVERHRQDWPNVVSVRLWDSYENDQLIRNSIDYAPDGCGWTGDDCTGELWTDLFRGSIPADLTDWGRPTDREERAGRDLACRQDLECWGEKHLVDATVTCQSLIEGLARYDFRWTHGFFGTKLERWRWDDRKEGSLSFTGDELQFMNAFGAWQRIVYWCHYNPTAETARVEVFPQ